MHTQNSSNSYPRASRPHMPEYGLLPADQGRGLLPWDWARQRLTDSRNYWIATTRPDNRSHLTAVWGVWWNDVFYFGTAQHSRKARNLAGNPNCVVSTENASEAVIVEGLADSVTNLEVLKQIGRRFEKKYSTLFPDDSTVFAVQPKLVFGFIDDEADFPGSATRWHFSPERLDIAQ